MSSSLLRAGIPSTKPSIVSYGTPVPEMSAICSLSCPQVARVIVNDYVLDRAETVAEEILSAGGKAYALQADVTDFGSMTSLVEQAASHSSPIDVSVNNAGNAAAKAGAAGLMKRVLKNYIIRRIGEPSDVAAMVMFLASSSAGWTTGHTYPVRRIRSMVGFASINNI